MPPEGQLRLDYVMGIFKGRKENHGGVREVKVETRAGFQGKGSLGFLPRCDFGRLRKTGLGLRKDYLIPVEAMGPIS